MTVPAMEALDWLEGVFLSLTDATPEKQLLCGTALSHVDVIRSAFPASPSPTEDESMLICAVRYAQGRMTYVVSEACGWVQAKWPTLSSGTRDVVRRDLREFLDLGEKCSPVLGMETDAQEWRELATWIEAQT